jgi:hypothetical protein
VKEQEPGDLVAGTVAREQPQLRIKFHSLPAPSRAVENRLVQIESDISGHASVELLRWHPADCSSYHEIGDKVHACSRCNLYQTVEPQCLSLQYEAMIDASLVG